MNGLTALGVNIGDTVGAEYYSDLDIAGTGRLKNCCKLIGNSWKIDYWVQPLAVIIK